MQQTIFRRNVFPVTRYILFLNSLLPVSLIAQVPITSRGSTYTQDFNSLSCSGAGIAWMNNSTLPGWYSSESVYRAGNGSSNSGALYSFGVAAMHPETDRALGSLVSSSTGTIYFGIRLMNNTCNDLTEFEISYAGEQWRNASNPSVQKLDFQYQVDAAGLEHGSWNDLDELDFTGPKTSGSPNELDGNDTASRTFLTATLSSIILSPGQEIWFRWKDMDDDGTDHGLAIDDISISANGPVCFFRTKATGGWDNPGNWEQSDDSSTWINAVASPSCINGKITISSPYAVAVNSSITVDQLTVDSNATLIYADAAGSALTVHDGPGADIIIDGEFRDNSPNSIVWKNSASWKLGSSGTLLRTRNTSSSKWRDTYYEGIAAIPSTANWIVRKTGTENPSFTGTAMTYPNLIIENTSGTIWNTGAGSIFTGSSDFPKIKGRLDIGGAGTDAVNFLNDNTHTSPVLVSGDLIVRSGSTLRNYGTGFEIQGNLTVDGAINYSSGTGARKLVFSGGKTQTINGTGTLNLLDFIINKSLNELTLNRSVVVDGILSFTNGIVNSSTENLLTINSAGSVSGAGNSSYVDGPVRYNGLNSFTFPVGKEGDYQPLSVSLSAAGISDFTCEYFHSNPRSAFNDSVGSGLDHISACEYWVLSRNTGDASKNISLDWDANSCGVTFLPDLRVAHWEDSVWKDEGNTNTNGATLSGSVTSDVISDFSPFTLASSSPDNPLPVELLDFTAHYNGKNVDLKWETASEINSYYFAVERSADGISFSEIATVQAAGYSSTTKEYSTVDPEPLTGTSFYHLKQVDNGGETKYSKTISINTDEPGTLAIENIFSENGILYFQISCKGGSHLIFEILDITGRKIFSITEVAEKNKHQFAVPQSSIAKGIYLLKADDGKNIRMKKFVKGTQ